MNAADSQFNFDALGRPVRPAIRFELKPDYAADVNGKISESFDASLWEYATFRVSGKTNGDAIILSVKIADTWRIAAFFRSDQGAGTTFCNEVRLRGALGTYRIDAVTGTGILTEPKYEVSVR